MKYSYTGERAYYEQALPGAVKPYWHLHPYITNWLDPERHIRGKRILDLGAGECEYSRLFTETFEARSVIACELIHGRMKFAAGPDRNPRLLFVVGDCFRLPFRDGTFDTVWLGLVIHQLPDLAEALQEIYRVLKPGGVYIGLEPNPFNIIVLKRYLWGDHSPNQYLLWPWRLRNALQAAGFEGSRISYCSGRSPCLRGPFVGTSLGILATKAVAHSARS